MSVLVMGLCFRATFGDPMLKSVAVALADHASDDGSRVWPSVSTLADKTEISHRTVQYKLRDLEAAGLIVCVDEGGKGAKDTREYRFDMKRLQALANGEIELSKGAADASLEGAADAPINDARVQLTTNKGAADDNKGAAGAPEPSITINKPSCAHERASVKGARAPVAKKAVTQIVLVPADVSWATWIAWLTDRDHRDLAVAAGDAGRMLTASRWPSETSPLPVVDRSATIGKRRTGDAA